MADIFISYSKMQEHLTRELAQVLEAAGYSTWWDTSLLPGLIFPTKSTSAGCSKGSDCNLDGKLCEIAMGSCRATLADEQKKLITLCNAALDFRQIPLPFNTRQTELVTALPKIFAALASMQILPRRKADPEPVKVAVQHRSL